MSCVYDPVDNLIEKTDQAGNTVYYAYDPLNRRTLIDYPGENDSLYTYDSAGNLLSAVNQNATVSYAYDALGRIVLQTANGLALQYQYSLQPQPKTRTILYPGGERITELRDVRDNVVRIENLDGVKLAEYAYDLGLGFVITRVPRSPRAAKGSGTEWYSACVYGLLFASKSILLRKLFASGRERPAFRECRGYRRVFRCEL